MSTINTVRKNFAQVFPNFVDSCTVRAHKSINFLELLASECFPKDFKTKDKKFLGSFILFWLNALTNKKRVKYSWCFICDADSELRIHIKKTYVRTQTNFYFSRFLLIGGWKSSQELSGGLFINRKNINFLMNIIPEVVIFPESNIDKQYESFPVSVTLDCEEYNASMENSKIVEKTIKAKAYVLWYKATPTQCFYAVKVVTDSGKYTVVVDPDYNFIKHKNVSDYDFLLLNSPNTDKYKSWFPLTSDLAVPYKLADNRIPDIL